MRSADGVRAQVRRLDKDIATSSTRPIAQILAASIGSRRFNTDLIGIAGVASLLLASIGVYAVTAFSISRRTREIGIRLTLGARPAQVIRSMLAGEWAAIALGLSVGAVGAILVSRGLAPMLFGASGVEPALVGGTAAFLAVAAAIASYIPARRATLGDPNVALRSD